MATRPPSDPFDSVRDAFESLGTSEKAAFVLEATFSTIGQALAETGRRAAAVLDDLDIDSWFAAPAEPAVGEPPMPPPAAPPPAAAPAPTRAKKPPAPKAPRRRPPTDDEA